MKVLSKKLIFWLINACLSGVIFFMTFDYRSLVKLDQSYLVFFSILTFFIVLANVFKNTELAQEKIQTFIKKLPGALNHTAMSTYEMILEEGRKEVRVILDRERQRAQEEHQRAQEEYRRAQEEHQRAQEAIQREEEERQRLDQVIIHLFKVIQLPIPEIAELTMREASYIEALITRQGDEKMTNNSNDE